MPERLIKSLADNSYPDDNLKDILSDALKEALMSTSGLETMGKINQIFPEPQNRRNIARKSPRPLSTKRNTGPVNRKI